MSVYHWSNKSLYVEVPLIVMLAFYFILYFSALLPFFLTTVGREKAISRVLHASSKTETDRLFSQKILPNFWHTAILTTSVGNNNTDGKILKFHSFFDLERDGSI